ncbi:MAG: tRNA (guanosine(46)-N7)-methyltransferase TrmB [Eubacteriaceae bacterium]|nr:tRNA (guanosine(46)-N7)-methyltransferase TrmB [Eubacteriaceae bacterium]
MRQRRIKDLEERLNNHSDLITADGKQYKGKWKDIFDGDSKLYLEFGCGKGKFIAAKAAADPYDGFIAVEGQPSVAVLAADKIKESEITNIRLVCEVIKNIEEYFAENELDGMYLNFSDPWPKARHSKRRLTYRSFLESYRKIIKPGGFVEFKTDNDGLYDFTLEELDECSFRILEQTRDLHSTEYESNGYRTEYEEKFSSKGKNINYIKFEI